MRRACSRVESEGSGFRVKGLQDYLAHKKMHPLGPHRRIIPRVIWRS